MDDYESIGEEDEIIGEAVYVDENGNEIPADVVGFSLKRIGRKAGGLARKAIRSPLVNPIETIRKTAQIIRRNPAVALFPPVASFVLLRDAMKKRPGAKAKVDAIKLRAESGDQRAREAFTNLALANEVRKAGVDPAEVMPDYPPEDVTFSEQYADPSVSDEVEEPTMAYDQDQGPYDAVSGLWDKLKKIGPMLDISNPKNPLRAGVTSIPGIGPGVVAAGDMMAKARSGAKDALAKIDQVKKLAAGGDPLAQKALTNLHTANALDKAAEQGTLTGMRIFRRFDWFPLISTYRRGVTGIGPAPGWKPGGV